MLIARMMLEAKEEQQVVVTKGKLCKVQAKVLASQPLRSISISMTNLKSRSSKRSAVPCLA